MNTAGGYNNSYGNLLYKEGVINSETDSTYATNGFQKLTTPPLGFAGSGAHHTTGTAMNTRGSAGGYWSRTARSSNAYDLYFGDKDAGLQGSNGRCYGFSLRCVAW